MKDRDRSHQCNLALLIVAAAGMTAVQGESANPTGQTREAETVKRSEWPTHPEAEPR